MKNKTLEKFSGGLIFLSTILITLQISISDNALLSIFDILDYVIIFLFAVEFTIRLTRDTKGEFQWLIFDGLILFASIVVCFVVALDYGEFIIIARLLRVLRLFKIKVKNRNAFKQSIIEEFQKLQDMVSHLDNSNQEILRELKRR